MKIFKTKSKNVCKNLKLIYCRLRVSITTKNIFDQKFHSLVHNAFTKQITRVENINVLVGRLV